MRIFADCADLDIMETLRERVSGYTTNPTLLRRAGVSDYEAWTAEAAERFPTHSLSVEVVGDDFDSIERQAWRLDELGGNLLVKVPCMLTDGTPTFSLVRHLSVDCDIPVNVTAVMTMMQMECSYEALRGGAEAFVSVFAGRVADTGIDPVSLIQGVGYRPYNVELVWASAREAYNLHQATTAGCDVITMSPELIGKIDAFWGKDLLELSRETVVQFKNDAIAAGLSL